MIFTIGLGNLTNPRELATLARKLDASVIDARASLKYRRAGFGRIQLTDMLTRERVDYTHAPWLGGLPASKRDGRALPPIPRPLLRQLADRHARHASLAFMGNALLVCACGTPGDCHRHLTIGLPVEEIPGSHVWHVYNDDEHGEQFIQPRELQRAIDDDDDYEFFRARDVWPS